MQLIYVADPMCSWCYGISEEVASLKSKYAEKMGFQLVMGGLRPYNTETMQDLGEMLSHHWDAVEERSGRPFKRDILSDVSFIYDTEPPSRAVISMRAINPEAEFDFFKDVQVAFYRDNENTNDEQTYVNLLPKYGVDAETFLKYYHSEGMKSAVKVDFAIASKLEVRGFPTLMLESDEAYHVISRGYAPVTTLEIRIQAIIA